MKPFNRLFVFIYYVVGLVADILHPVSVEGMDKLPRSGALLCPNHSSNWTPFWWR
jgi:1-acyl-sn-glycerol-3-phosphate acyltransferase